MALRLIPADADAETGGVDGDDGAESAEGDDSAGGEQNGGRKKKRKKMSGKKRGLNSFFKLMLDAKKKKLPSFMYNGKKYVGKAHHRLGMIYKRLQVLLRKSPKR